MTCASISANRVETYRGAKTSRNLREIGQTLGVANILEGSVRRAGNLVVITVQLIDAVHDRHIWANRYGRTIKVRRGLQGSSQPKSLPLCTRCSSGEKVPRGNEADGERGRVRFLCCARRRLRTTPIRSWKTTKRLNNFTGRRSRSIQNLRSRTRGSRPPVRKFSITTADRKLENESTRGSRARLWTCSRVWPEAHRTRAMQLLDRRRLPRARIAATRHRARSLA